MAKASWSHCSSGICLSAGDRTLVGLVKTRFAFASVLGSSRCRARPPSGTEKPWEWFQASTSLLGCVNPALWWPCSPVPCWLCRDWAAGSPAVRPLPSVCCPFAVLPRTFVMSGGDTLGTSSQRSSSPTVACCFAFVQTLSFNESNLSPERETKQDSIWAVSRSCWLDEGRGEWDGGQNGRWTREPSVSSACWLALSKGTIGAWNC